MSNPFWASGFGPLLPDTAAVPFGDRDALAAQLETRRFAAFVVEPVQAESGIRVPDRRYLETAQTLCRKTGTLLVLDEVQTGLHRTGPFLAAHHFGLEPDMVVLAKALSGGLVPSSAVLLSDAVFDSVYSSLSRAFVHTSTYSENGLAMRAGLATLDVLEDERLGERAVAMGEYVRQPPRPAPVPVRDGPRGAWPRAPVGHRVPGPPAAPASGVVRDAREVHPGWGRCWRPSAARDADAEATTSWS